MAKTELILKEINKLQLHNIDDDWVFRVINSGYQEIPPLTPIYSETLLALGTDLLKILRGILGMLECVLSEHHENDSITWFSLIDGKLRKDELLTVLFYLVRRAVDANVEMDQMEFIDRGILAARIYLRLLAMGGSWAQSIYHVQFYLMCLKCFHCGRELLSSDQGQKAISPKLRSLFVELNHFIVDLKSVIEKSPFYFFTTKEKCLTDTITSLVESIKFAKTDIHPTALVEQREIRDLRENIHDCLNALVALSNLNICEDRTLVLNIIFCEVIFPKLLDSTNRLCEVLMSEFISLVIILSRENKSAFWTPFQTLIQRLCCAKDRLDRVEVREGRLSVVLELISHLSPSKFKIIFNWMKQLSQTGEASYRNLALEIFSSIIERSFNCTGTSYEYTEWIFKNNDERSLPSSDDNSNDGNNGGLRPGFFMVYNDNTDRVQYLDISELLNLIADRATDIKGSIRAKALAILMKLFNTTDEKIAESLKNLKGGRKYDFLLQLAAKKLKNEKSEDRKFAVEFLSTLFQKDSTLITEDNLSAIVNACFDIDFHVRLAAVLELANLIRKQPDALTINAFLDGVIKRDPDPEREIIGAIRYIIEELIISKFTMFSENTQPGVLPWFFLTMVIKRDLKSHLCFHLNGMANNLKPELVTILTTHIGKHSDENCWLMLSCLSKVVPVKEVGFAVQYLYESTSNPVQSVNVKEMVVDSLVNWCSVISQPHKLRVVLISELRTMTRKGVEVGESSISTPLRRAMIILTKKLNPDNIQWATECLEICHKHITDGQNLERWLIAIDFALIAPQSLETILLDALIKMVMNCGHGAYYTGPAQLWRSEAACAALARAAPDPGLSAESAAEALARLLVRGHQVPPATRIAALNALADVSRRSCSLDALLFCGMHACLQDERLVLHGGTCKAEPGAEVGIGAGAASVRGLAARLLTRELRAGYLRFDSRRFCYKYLALLAHDDPEVRKPVERYIRGSVGNEVILNHFLSAVLIFNSCGPAAFNQAETEAPFLSLQGEEKREARMRVYRFMTSTLNVGEGQRLKSRLANFIEDKLSEARRGALAPPVAAALADALAELRLPIAYPLSF